MSNDIEYTTSGYPDNQSEVIRLFAYNENTRDVHVVLQDNEVYSYPNVPQSVLDEFIKSESAGAYYNTHFKRTYGPGTHAGSYGGAPWKFVEKIDKNEETRVAVGTPKGLTYADDAVVTNRDAEQSYVTLGAGVNEPATGGAVSSTGIQSVFTTNANSGPFNINPFRTHVVTFTIEGMEGEREYQASTQNVDAAVADLNAYASQLGLTVKVLRVVVHFD
jgi:hypothetical protein